MKKRPHLIFFLAVLVPVSMSLGQESSDGPRDSLCAFRNEEFMRHMGILSLTAQYFLDHQRWPETQEDIKELRVDGLESGQIEALLSGFDRIEWKTKRKEIVLVYTFKGHNDSGVIRLRLSPGNTLDAIIQSAREIQDPTSGGRSRSLARRSSAQKR